MLECLTLNNGIFHDACMHADQLLRHACCMIGTAEHPNGCTACQLCCQE